MAENNFHPELENIQQEYRRRIELVENDLTPEKEKEILKQVIAEKFQAVPTQTPVAAQTQTVPATAQPNQIDDLNQPYQHVIDALVQTTFEKGLSKAVQEVRAMKNAFLIDAFHDELANKFYAEIKTKENA